MSGSLVRALLPPAGLALLALVLLLGRRRGPVAVVLLVLVALATRGASRVLLGGLLVVSAPPGTPPGAIVVLPGDAPDMINPAGEEPGLFTLDRLRTAAALQRRTALPILVTGGAEQAAGMAESLRDDFRVPVRWEETRARDVWQSAAYSAELLQSAGVSRVFLVTDAWDERLAAAAFHRAGIEVTPAPVHRPNPLAFDRFILFPGTPAWLDSAVAIQQWAGLTCDALPLCLALVKPGPN